jgi:predicted transposase/invertase (TIGR01784 family)
MISKDTLWKGIIEDLVEEFVGFFYADYLGQINIERGFVFLDKELEQLVPQSEAMLRHADKLFKAWLKDGGENWFLVHVEVQGYNDPDFARRMYEYTYRIQDRYQKPLTSLVIFTGTDRRYHFTEYRYSFFGTELIYRFQTFILMDHTPEILRLSGNPFGLVLEVARREQDCRKKDDQFRFDIKAELVRHLFRQGIVKQKIRHLLNFIAFYILFEENSFLHKFEGEIISITKTPKPMGIEEAILNEMKEKGLEEGRKEGHQEGHREGLKEGIDEKERIVVIRASQKGMDLDTIADLVDISRQKVEEIIADYQQEQPE